MFGEPLEAPGEQFYAWLDWRATWNLLEKRMKPVAEDIDKRIAQYVMVRDRIKEVEDRHTAELKPLRDIQERLTGLISQFMEANNITDNLKSKSGTCYLSTRYTASLADPEAFMNYVIKSQKFELLDRRANTTAVKDYVQENNELPAGCNLNAVQTLGVRRPTGGKAAKPKITRDATAAVTSGE